MSINKADLAKKIKDEGFVAEVAKKYFDNYDINTNGYIEKKELSNVMKSISMTYFNCEPEKGVIEAQFSKLDKDKNNKLDLTEFKSFIKDFLQMIVEF